MCFRARGLAGRPSGRRALGLSERLCVLKAFSPTDHLTGIMNVKNATASASGTYRCTASNLVGVEECFLTLRVTPREYLCLACKRGADPPPLNQRCGSGGLTRGLTGVRGQGSAVT